MNIDFNDLPKYVCCDTMWSCDYGITAIEDALVMLGADAGCDLEPDFQRPHVWTAEQQVKYVEHLLMGGRSARDFWFNSPTWGISSGGAEPVVLVDGLQRITALRRFAAGDMRVFGQYAVGDITPRAVLNRLTIRLHVNTLATRREILAWYLQINAGGTPHSQEELDRVRQLMDAEPLAK